MSVAESEPPVLDDLDPEPGAIPSLPQVPTPLGRKVLLFVALALVEYWVAPLFLGITNYAGLWSDVGVLLFFVTMGSLAVFVVLPLLPHLREALRPRRNRWLFHGIWSGAFVVGLLAVNIVQFTDGPSSPAFQLGTSTVYSPFGGWPTLTMYVPALQLWATWNLEAPAILFLLSWLSASSVVLGPARGTDACPLPSNTLGLGRRRWASVGVLAPLGLISGCPGCAPVYFAALAMIAPGAAERASASVPLVPWIGFAGLLYLAGFALSLWIIHRSTRSQQTAPESPQGG